MTPPATTYTANSPDPFAPRWHDGESSAVRAYAYDRASQTLFVRFVGKSEDCIYAYHGVSEYRYRQLRKAESRGRFVALSIKPSYPAVECGTVAWRPAKVTTPVEAVA